MKNKGSDKVFKGRKRIILACFGFMLVFVAMAISPIYLYAGDKIRLEWVMPKHYPAEGFDGVGTIDRIDLSQGEVVISDMFHKIATYVVFHTPEKEKVPAYRLRPGDYVGFIKDSTTKQIVSFWLIDMEKK